MGKDDDWTGIATIIEAQLEAGHLLNLQSGSVSFAQKRHDAEVGAECSARMLMRMLPRSAAFYATSPTTLG